MRVGTCHTPFVALKSKDGGVDVLTYRDPLSTIFPRMKVQITAIFKRAEQVEALREHLQAEPDLGLRERCEHLAKSEGVRVSEPTLW